MAKLDYFQDSGSNYQFGDKRIPPQVQFSQFDLSYVNTTTAKQGQLIPVWFSYYYPGDSFQVSIDNLIRVVNPPLVPLMSRQRVFFHLFRMDYTQMWTHWEAMMKKGWSGTFEAVLPTLTTRLAVGGKINPLLARGSLADHLGFNFSDYVYKAGDEGYTVTLPALPFLAYQLIYRDYYLNKPIAYEQAKKNNNLPLLAFFPEADYDLMIHGPMPTGLTLEGTSDEALDGQPISPLAFGQLRYRDFAPDYFTTALPYVMKGDVPSTGVHSTSDSVLGVRLSNGEVTPVNIYGVEGSYDDRMAFSSVYNSGTLDYGTIANPALTPPTYVGSLSSSFLPYTDSPSSMLDSTDAVAGSFPLSFTDSAFTFTQLQLRQLWTDTLILEKMTRTDGTYGEFLQVFFGETPSHWTSHRAVYVGGTYQPIVFEEVLQTVPTQDDGTLGTIGGHGISSSSGSLGSFHADDFGVAMVIMSIMPDTYYSQGWMREHLYSTQEDFPLPERSLLGPQPVTVQELYYDPRAEPLQRTVLFGYQSRFDELRYRQNECHGLVADDANLSFAPYVQNRKFTASPVLNLDFLTTEGNVDNEWLTAPDEPAYMVQVANRVVATRPLPYVAPPTAIMM